MDVKEATKLLADEAERRGADANDSTGIVRDLVTSHGLSFSAWFVVCCELADRNAKSEGFNNQADRALAHPKFQKALSEYRENFATKRDALQTYPEAKQ